MIRKCGTRQLSTITIATEKIVYGVKIRLTRGFEQFLRQIYNDTDDSNGVEQNKSMLITLSRARNSPVFLWYICQSSAQSWKRVSEKSNYYKGQGRLYLLVEDAVLLVDVSDVSCILVRTLSGELASLVDTKRMVINEEQGMHQSRDVLLIKLANNPIDCSLVRWLVVGI